MANPEPFQNFHIGQKAIIIYKNKALLVKDAQYKDWTMPGGRVNQDEDPMEGLNREMIEEIGIGFKELDIEPELIVCLPFNKYKIGHDGTVLMLQIYKFEISEEIEVKISDEHSDFKWITAEEIDKYDFFDNEVRNIYKLLLH